MLKKAVILVVLVVLAGCCLWVWGQDAPKQQQPRTGAGADHSDQTGNPVPNPSPVVQPPVNPPISQPPAAKQQQEPPPKPLPWFLRPEWVMVWVTVVYTILTGRTLRAIRRQAELMESQLTDARRAAAESATTTAATLAALQRQADLMDETAKRQLRAYVVIERGIIGNVANPIHNRIDSIETVARLLDPQAGPIAQITIKNTGQTPAYQVVHWGRICVEKLPLDASLPLMPEPEFKFWSVMGPGIVEVKTLRLPKPLNQDELDQLRSGSSAIYCHGEIAYLDAFKQRRSTKYRCMYSAHCGVIGISTDMIYCEDGNDAD